MIHKYHHHQYIHQTNLVQKNPSIITCKIDEYHNNQMIKITTKLVHKLIEIKWGKGKAYCKIQGGKVVSCKTCKIHNNRQI